MTRSDTEKPRIYGGGPAVGATVQYVAENEKIVVVVSEHEGTYTVGDTTMVSAKTVTVEFENGNRIVLRAGTRKHQYCGDETRNYWERTINTSVLNVFNRHVSRAWEWRHGGMLASLRGEDRHDSVAEVVSQVLKNAVYAPPSMMMVASVLHEPQKPEKRRLKIVIPKKIDTTAVAEVLKKDDASRKMKVPTYFPTD